MNERDMEEILHEALVEYYANSDQVPPPGVRIRSFRKAGVMTDDRGIVLEIREGDVGDERVNEFEFTIVQSRRST